jgi:hypothetical protein
MRKRSSQVGVDYRVPLLDGELIRRAADAETGVVDEDVDTPPACDDLRHGAVDILGSAYIGGDLEDVVPAGVGVAGITRSVGPGTIDTGDPVPRCQVRPGDDTPDAAGGTGYDGYRSAGSQILRFPVSQARTHSRIAGFFRNSFTSSSVGRLGRSRSPATRQRNPRGCSLSA